MKRPLLMRVAASVAWLLVVACAQTPSNPPELGPCVSDSGLCPTGAAGGGSSGATDGGASSGACSVNSNDAQCTQCAAASCCASFDACTASTDCRNLLSCEQSCAGAAGCVANCEGQSPNGVGLLNALTSCLEGKCPVCSESGIGDPCIGQSDTCNSGLSCSGLWCTRACARSSDCAGLGAGSGNVLGLPNACVATATSGRECMPGCQTDADCAPFPGSYCFTTTSSEGASVQICTPPSDAGAD